MFLVPALVAAALCRYTVRDIGFVDVAGATYSLARVGPARVEPAGVEPEPATRPLSDTNLTFVALPARATADPRVAAAGPEGGWVLHRAGLAPLRLAGLDATEEAAVTAAVRSELRDTLLARTVDSFAVLVVVEGASEEDRERVDAELAAAREGLALLSDQLPRAIVRPLAEVRVTRSARGDERVLRWALGLDPEESRPAVALVYGRGRLAGEVIVGDGIERGELLAQLALVGESCECDTERDWLGAPSLPLAWTADRRARAAADLGFDPESPLVRAEVARILERGRPAGPNARRSGVDDVVFGYDEGALEVVAARAEVPAAEMSGSPVRVFEASGGDDWGFEEAPLDETGAASVTEGEGRRFDPLLLGAGAVLVLVTLGAAVVLLGRGAR